MRALAHLVLTGFRLFLREPAAFFFTLVFPLLLLALFGVIFGNEPNPQWGTGFGYIDFEVPALAAIIIANVALMGIPIATATARETGVLRRYRSTPVRPLTLFTADLVVYLGMSVAGMGILVIAARVLFGVRFAGSWPVVAACFVFAAVSFIAVGYLIASLSPTARVAQTVGMAAFFPMMFLSGAAMPRQIMPAKVVAVSDWLPLTHVVTLLQGAWFGRPLAEQVPQLLWLAGLLLIGGLVSMRFFRWE